MHQLHINCFFKTFNSIYVKIINRVLSKKKSSKIGLLKITAEVAATQHCDSSDGEGVPAFRPKNKFNNKIFITRLDS